MSHDQIVDHAVSTVGATDLDALQRAWIASLATRDQRLRSVWPRAVFLSRLTPHDFTSSVEFRPNRCAVCGVRQEEEPVTLDELNDDAFWFRPLNVAWAAAAVDFLGREATDSAAVDADVRAGRSILDGILDAIRSLPASAELSELAGSLVGKLKSNKVERTVVLEALGYAGVLAAAGHPCYADELITYDDAQSRQPAETYKREWAYPVRFWTGADGVTERGLAVAVD